MQPMTAEEEIDPQTFVLVATLMRTVRDAALTAQTKDLAYRAIELLASAIDRSDFGQRYADLCSCSPVTCACGSSFGRSWPGWHAG